MGQRSPLPTCGSLKMAEGRDLWSMLGLLNAADAQEGLVDVASSKPLQRLRQHG